MCNTARAPVGKLSSQVLCRCSAGAIALLSSISLHSHMASSLCGQVGVAVLSHGVCATPVPRSLHGRRNGGRHNHLAAVAARRVRHRDHTRHPKDEQHQHNARVQSRHVFTRGTDASKGTWVHRGPRGRPSGNHPQCFHPTASQGGLAGTPAGC